MEKRKKEKKVKKAIFILLAVGVLTLIFSVGWIFSSFRFVDGTGFSAGVWQRNQLRIHFLDVGQGDCTVIELPDGKKMMVDGGNGTARNNRKILNYLNRHEIYRLDYLLLTHGDKDHCGGMESVLDAVEVSCIYLPYEATLTSGTVYLSLYQKALQSIPNVRFSQRYEHVLSEQGDYFFMFLSPFNASFSEKTDENEHSAVVWMDYAGISALFTGDMTSDAEKSLLEEYTLEKDVFNLNGMKVELEDTEILKVAHHGSADSSSLEWLELLNAETAVISCGAGNSYGHPSDRALKNLRTANPKTEIYRTDECGDIVITVSNGTYVTVYENQIQPAIMSAVKDADELCGLAYILKNQTDKLSYTENILL